MVEVTYGDSARPNQGPRRWTILVSQLSTTAGCSEEADPCVIGSKPDQASRSPCFAPNSHSHASTITFEVLRKTTMIE
jgi:hypothetical protein